MFTRWPGFTVYLAGQPIPLRLKALHFSESADFIRKVEEHNRRTLEGKADFAESFPVEDIKVWFSRWVRVEGKVLVDEQEITTGEQLYEVATFGVVHAVIGQLYDFARLSTAAGKASSSPSTSGPARETSGGDSPASSTEPGDGPTP